MNAELKQRWIAALRSGDFEQGYNCLSKGNKFCCLGVLADIEGVPHKDSDEDGEYIWNFGEKAVSTIYLGEVWADERGLCINDVEALIELNDKDKMSFLGIADWIEKNL